MSRLRFKPGDLAVVTRPEPGTDPMWIGMIVQVEHVGPFRRHHAFPDGWYAAQACDYGVRAASGESGTCRDFELSPIQPGADQAGVTDRAEIEQHQLA